MHPALMKDSFAPLGVVLSSTSNTTLAVQVQEGPEQREKSRRPALDVGRPPSKKLFVERWPIASQLASYIILGWLHYCQLAGSIEPLGESG